MIAILYLAIEPSARRLWPGIFVGWIRLLNGRGRDPRVGREVLVGGVFGAALSISAQFVIIAPAWFGLAPPPPSTELLATPWGASDLLVALSDVCYISATFGFLFAILLLVFRMLLRRQGLAIAAFFVSAALMVVGQGLLAMVLFLASTAVFVFVLFRFGQLAVLAGLSVFQLLVRMPMTSDLSVWYAKGPILAVAIVLGLGAYGFYVSTGGQQLFSAKLLEAESGAKT